MKEETEEVVVIYGKIFCVKLSDSLTKGTVIPLHLRIWNKSSGKPLKTDMIKMKRDLKLL